MPQSETPHIRASLRIGDSILRDYCRYLFPERMDGAFIVSNRVMFGRLLIAHVRVSDTPVIIRDEASELEPNQDLIEKDKNNVLFIFPVLPSSRNLQDKWLYYNKTDTESLNDALKAVFDHDFNVFYFNGLRLKYQKREIINSFIASRKLYSRDEFDTLSKRAYRRELEYQRGIIRKLENRAERIDRANKNAMI